MRKAAWVVMMLCTLWTVTLAGCTPPAAQGEAEEATISMLTDPTVTVSTVPTLDMAAPAVTETATLALG